MKKIIMTMTAVVVAVSTMAQENRNSVDTLKTIKDAHKLVIIETPTGVSVNVKGADGKDDFIYECDYDDNTVIKTKQDTANWELKLPFCKPKSPKSHWKIVSDGLSIGMVGGLGTPAGVDMQMAKSCEFSWLNTVALNFYPSAGKSFASVGVGLLFRNYRLNNKLSFVKNDNGKVEIQPVENPDKRNSSRLYQMTLNVPLLWNQHIYKDLSFRFGPIVDFNLYSSIHNEQSTDYETTCYRIKGLKQRRVTVELFGVLSWKAIGWYVRYSPQTVFGKDNGVQFHSISTGAMLFF